MKCNAVQLNKTLLKQLYRNSTANFDVNRRIILQPQSLVSDSSRDSVVHCRPFFTVTIHYKVGIPTTPEPPLGDEITKILMN